MVLRLETLPERKIFFMITLQALPLVGCVAFVNQAGTLMHMIQQETLNPKLHF
jgi:hypothetical protein